MSELEHYGVKGMRWGVRKKNDASTISARNEGVLSKADGSITISKGASIQRLVRSNGESLPMKDMTYASINDYDNAKYIKTIGGKGFFGGGRDQILSIKTVAPIKAPSKEEATRLFSELMIKDSAFRKQNTNILGASISDKEFAAMKANPTGRVATAWYDQTNVKLTFDASFDPDAPRIQAKVREHYVKNGYNALRDENDVNSKIAVSPIIIFNPEKSLKVVSVTEITDELRKANKAKLKQYKTQGKDWLEKELYT